MAEAYDKRQTNKNAVRAASAAALPANTASGIVLTADANGALAAQDGVTLAVDDAFLVKDEVAGANNGWYVVTDLGSASTPWRMERRDDADTSEKVKSGANSPVSEGTDNAGLTFQIITANPIVLGTTSLSLINQVYVAADVDANVAHTSGDGSDHADVATNTTHSSGDGSDHSIVLELSQEETNDTLQAKRIAKAVWDHGGGLTSAGSPYAIGPTLPDNAIVTRAWYRVVTTLTSGTDAAVIGLGIVTDDADGLVAPLAISAGGNIWDAGNHEGIQDGTVANFAEQTTAARLFEGTITTEDTTAGKILLFAEYVVTE